MLFRQTLLYLPAQVLGPVFQFISIIAWTYFLTPEDMGVFALIAAIQELAFTGTTMWFTLYTMRYHDPAAPDDQRGRFLDSEMMVMAGGSVATLAVIALSPLFTSFAWSWELGAAAFAYTVTRSLVSHLSDRARTEHDTMVYSVLQIVWPVFGLLFGLCLVSFVEASAANVLWGYAIAQALSLLVAGWRMEFGWKPLRFSSEHIRDSLKYGAPLVIGGFLIWLANNGIRFVVEMRESAAAVGLITVGWGLGLRVAAFASMLVTAAAFPIAMKRARDEGMDAGQAQLERNGVLLLAILAPAAAGLYAIGDPLVRLAVAPEFQDVTAAVLPLAILAGAFRNFRIHFGEQVFLLHERPEVSLWNDAVDAVASLGGVALGLWLYGLPGAVAGAAAGAALSMLVTMAAGWVVFRFSFPFAALWRICLATAVMLAAVLALPLMPTVLSVATAVAAGGLVYAAVLAAIYPELMRKLMGLVRAK